MPARKATRPAQRDKQRAGDEHGVKGVGDSLVIRQQVLAAAAAIHEQEHAQALEDYDAFGGDVCSEERRQGCAV